MEMDVMQMAAASEAELNKLTKAQLVAGIKKNSYLPGHYRDKVKELENTLNENATAERAACVMLAAFCGVELERNEYSGQIETKKLNILELAGLVTAKCAAK